MQNFGVKNITLKIVVNKLANSEVKPLDNPGPDKSLWSTYPENSCSFFRLFRLIKRNLID